MCSRNGIYVECARCETKPQPGRGQGMLRKTPPCSFMLARSCNCKGGAARELSSVVSLVIWSGVYGIWSTGSGGEFVGRGISVGDAMQGAVDSRLFAGRAPRRTSSWWVWPSPPSTPPPFANAHRILLDWGHEHGLRGHKLLTLCALLRRDYLLQLPLPRGCKGFENLEVVEPRQLRYLFRRQCATLLGWRQRISEGDPNGFSEDVNRIIREEVYRDVPVRSQHAAVHVQT